LHWNNNAWAAAHVKTANMATRAALKERNGVTTTEEDPR
jgi:hypothetical protein